MMPGDVELHVEELVLHGFAPGDRHRIGESMKRELTRLLAERGVPPSLAQSDEIERLDGAAFKVRPGFGAEAFGVRVARSVYEGFGR